MEMDLILYWVGLFIFFILFIPIVTQIFYKKYGSVIYSGNDILLVFIVCLVLFFAAPFTYFAVTMESSMGFITTETREAWISFFGSIIGGALTLFGVWWSITSADKARKEENKRRDKERKEELAIQYKPMIKFIVDSIYISSKNDVHTLSFYIQNTGRGEAYNLKIVFNDDVEIIDNNSDMKNIHHINIFPKEESHLVEIKYHKKLNIKECKEDRVIDFDVFYNDLYSVYKFTSIGQIFIHPKNWPYTIENIYGEIISEKNEKKEEGGKDDN